MLNSDYAAYLISKLILKMIHVSLGIGIYIKMKIHFAYGCRGIWLNLIYIFHVDCKMLIYSIEAIGRFRFDY